MWRSFWTRASPDWCRVSNACSLIGRLMLYDALDMSVREMKVRKNPKCPICGPNPTITALIDYQEFCGVRGSERTHEATDGEDPAEQELEQLLVMAATKAPEKVEQAPAVFHWEYIEDASPTKRKTSSPRRTG